MATVALKVYNPVTNTLIGTLSSAYGQEWQTEFNGPGQGHCKLAHDAAEVVATPSLLNLFNVIRVNIDGTDRAAFLRGKTPKKDGDSYDELRIGGPGPWMLLKYATVYPSGGLTGDLQKLPAAATRMFGWMSPEFDHAGWTSPESWGTWRAQTWETVRPEAFPATEAQFIWTTADDRPEEDNWFRKTFNLAADTDVVVVAAADDEYDLYLDGILLLSARGAYSWEQHDESPVLRLPAGQHTVAVRGHNLPRAFDNPAWILAAVLEVGEDGGPLATNQTYELFTDATGGLWTVTVAGATSAGMNHNVSAGALQTVIEGLAPVGAGNVSVSGTGAVPANQRSDAWADATGGNFSFTVDGVVAPAIAWNATAAQVEAALEALPNVDGVTVTGAGTSGDPWVIRFDGPTIRRTSVTLDSNDSGLTGAGQTINITTVTSASDGDPWVVEFVAALSATPVTLTADGSGLSGGTLTVNETQAGQAADVIVQTDTTWASWSGTEPGMNAYEIMDAVLTENQAYSPTLVDAFTLAGTSTLDAGGATWTTEMVLAVPVGTTAERVLAMLLETGIDANVTPALVLQMWEQRGTDLSGTVTLSASEGRPQHDQDGELFNVLLRRTNDGFERVVDAASKTAHGFEAVGFLGTQLQPGTSDPYSSQILADLSTEPTATTLEMVEELGDQPYDDYDVGDVVSAYGAAGVADHRVLSIHGTNEDGSLSWSIELAPDTF